MTPERLQELRDHYYDLPIVKAGTAIPPVWSAIYSSSAETNRLRNALHELLDAANTSVGCNRAHNPVP